MIRLVTRTYVEALSLAGLLSIAASIWLAVDRSPWAAAASLPWGAALGLLGWSKLAPADRVRRARRHPVGAYGVAGAGLLGAAVAGAWPVAIATTGIAGLLGYTTWYSRQHRPSGVLAVGEPLPQFPLTTVDGRRITSAALEADPHVILFYRGSWCPFCVAQVQGLAAEYRELARRGVKVALVSPQRAADTEELSRRFDAPMDFYVDADGAAARVLDLVQAGGTPITFGAGTDGDTVVPTVVITRPGGTVAWLHHADDHRVRPEPSTFLEIIDRAGIAVARRGA